jgi:DegV family protein with EDD domain
MALMTTSKKIRFITDSTCDIPEELVRKHQITVVPVFVNFGGGSFADDGVELKREDYYTKLATLRPFPTTSAMPPAMTEKAFLDAAKEADHVVAITVSSKLSGVYNAFRLGAQKLPADRFTLIDGQSTTTGLGWQVVIGAEVAEQTGDVEQVISAINRVRDATRVYAALGTLEFLHRSGRVGWAAAGIGTLLQIKPIIKVEDGEVKSLSRVRTFSRAVDELIRFAHDHAPLDRLAVLYGIDTDAAYTLKERLKDIAPPDNTYIVRINPAVGTHIGPNGLGIAPVSASWKNVQ